MLTKELGPRLWIKIVGPPPPVTEIGPGVPARVKLPVVPVPGVPDAMVRAAKLLIPAVESGFGVDVVNAI